MAFRTPPPALRVNFPRRSKRYASNVCTCHCSHTSCDARRGPSACGYDPSHHLNRPPGTCTAQWTWGRFYSQGSLQAKPGSRPLRTPSTLNSACADTGPSVDDGCAYDPSRTPAAAIVRAAPEQRSGFYKQVANNYRRRVAILVQAGVLEQGLDLTNAKACSNTAPEAGRVARTPSPVECRNDTLPRNIFASKVGDWCVGH